VEYVEYEGLKLPPFEQRELFNMTPEELHASRWYCGLPSSGNHDRKAAEEKGLFYERGVPAEKGCENRFLNRFFYIQALYRKGLDSMLVRRLQLQHHDRYIKDNIGYMPSVSWNDDGTHPYWAFRYYKSMSMMNLDYFYLANEIYIERLKMNELALFERAYEADGVNVSEEMAGIIERTWKGVINYNADGSSTPVGDNGYLSDTIFLEVGINGVSLLESAPDKDGTDKLRKLLEYLANAEDEFAKELHMPVVVRYIPYDCGLVTWGERW
jgi:hypothetical protein